jgi:hypothetical protein
VALQLAHRLEGFVAGPVLGAARMLPNSLSNIVRVASVRLSSRRMPVAASVAWRRRALSSPRCWGVMRLPSSASLSKVKAGIMSARARSRPSARI